MPIVVREIPLTNGLTVRFTDKTRRYFGDYHQVRVEVTCEVPLTPQLFEDSAAYESALKVLGGQVSYQKLVEHQGVATCDTADTVDRVIRHFLEHSISYFASDSFPRRLVQSELARIGSRSRSSFRPRA